MNKYSYKNLNVYQDAKSLVVDVVEPSNIIPNEQYNKIEEKIDCIARQLSALRSKYKE